jgi:cyclopropane fatty-acyl-phospholipid synthase-like methyltransferase
MIHQAKPYSESCDQNKEPILTVITPVLESKTRLLEIGSGTGQHAVYFSRHFPRLIWQTSDRKEYHRGINLWIDADGNSNVLRPITLDVSSDPWPECCFDAVFTANTLHIMHDKDVTAFFSNIGKSLLSQADLLIYGPFNYHGNYTSDSNARFDGWLKGNDPLSGIKDFEMVAELASNASMVLVDDYAMPANNRILHFRYTM